MKKQQLLHEARDAGIRHGREFSAHCKFWNISEASDIYPFLRAGWTARAYAPIPGEPLADEASRLDYVEEFLEAFCAGAAVGIVGLHESN